MGESEDDVIVPDLLVGGLRDGLGVQHEVDVDKVVDGFGDFLPDFLHGQARLQSFDLPLQVPGGKGGGGGDGAVDEPDGVLHRDGEGPALLEEGDVGLDEVVDVPVEVRPGGEGGEEVGEEGAECGEEGGAPLRAPGHLALGHTAEMSAGSS